MNVAQAIARILKAEGVDFLVAYPVNPLIEAAAEVDIRTIIVRQERVGLHMADAFSRLRSGDEIGVFCMQHGPGAENAYGGVAQAYGESVPILVIPAGYPRRVMNVDPNFSSYRQMAGIAKLTDHVFDAAAVNESMRRAFSALRNGRGRPVVVEVPFDVFGEDAADPSGYVPTFATRSGPDPAALDEAAALLTSATDPVIYAGQGVHYAKAWPQLRELAERLSIPVTTTLAGKSAFPEDHPLSLGCAGRTIGDQVRVFLDKADVILAIGASLTRTGFGQPMPRGEVTLIHATDDPADLQKDVAISHALVGDAALTLDGLLDRIGTSDRSAERIASEIATVRDPWLERWMPKLTSDERPINPYRVVHEMNNLIADEVGREHVVVTHDAGSPRDQMTPFWTSTEPLSYLGWGKTTQLGYGLGLAMGAKLAHPDKLCINVWGDAAIGFTGMDFETAVRERLPILSILLNNFSMAIEIPIMQVAQEKYGSTDISGNYADMAKAFGGYGERVTEPGEIVAALRRGIEATRAGQPALLEFITSKEIAYSTPPRSA